jgi:HEAT repeat protein
MPDPSSQPNGPSPQQPFPAAPEPAGPASSEPEAAASERETSALRQFLGLFVVPLVVVLVCVAVFVGFGWVAYEKHSTADLLDDLASPWPPRRRQAAYELSKVLMADPRALAEEPRAALEVRRLFRESDDERVRQYLALVLGHTRDREGVPQLLAALADPDSQTRIYSLWALGSIGDRSAREPLVAALSDSDPGIRKTAAFALGALGDPQALPVLEERLSDPATDVRWNVALSLARLGSGAGLAVVEQMADRSFLARVPDITRDQQEEAMLQAIPVLAVLKGEAARPALDRLAEEDPSLKVRQAAIEARRALAPEGGRAPAPEEGR